MTDVPEVTEESVARSYQAFAREEAHGRSPAYEELAEAVARDPDIVRFVASLPPGKHQPNLLFAAARYLLGDLAGAASLRDLVRGARAELTEVMLTRRTQTNEPARCAVLLPALARLPEPLALIDVGASAGLTMAFDRYSYDYAGHRLTGTDPDAPVLACQIQGPVPLPERIPAIAWRAGLDLNPLDATSDDDVRWLTSLVWPGEGDRDARLAAAIRCARREPPVVVKGDLTTDLPKLAAQAPPEATLVVCHSSVLWYVDQAGRERFAGAVRDVGARWLANELPGVVPGTAGYDQGPTACALALDGQMLAFADSHGAWLNWL